MEVCQSVKTKRQFAAIEAFVQLAVFLRSPDERMDKLEIALAFLRAGKVFRHFARRGEHGGEGDSHQLAVLAEIIEQRRENVFQLGVDVGVGRRRFAQDAVALVVRLVHQRLKQARLVGKMIIKRRLGNFGVIYDVLDGCGGIAGVRETLERGAEYQLAGVRNAFGHNLPNGRYK